MAAERVQRRLAAIVAADVVGYSRMMRDDEAGTLARLNALRQAVVDPKAGEFGGRIFKTMGDGLLIEFGSVVDAVQYAVDVQRELARRGAAVAHDRRIEFRVGVNLGDVIVEGDDVHGDGVNVAARLEGLAEPGGICASVMVYEGVRHKLDVGFTDLGEQSVKNIAEPIHVYAIAPDAGQGPTGASDALFRRPAVAVLPFANMSGDPEQDYLGDGLAEDIITALSLWRSFPVIARNSTFAYKGTSPDIRKVGEDLGARYVIEGSVRMAGNRVRVTAQLINAETGHHVWAEKYDRDLEDVFALQDELTERIAGTVAPELDRWEQKLASSKPPASLNAWEHVQRGIGLLSERTADGNVRARAEFDRAIELDPSYSRAFSGLSWSHHRDLQMGVGRAREDVLANALRSARQAIALDPADTLAHTMLGIALTLAEDFDEAIAALERAIDINPSDANAYVSIGATLTLAGRPDEGVAALERAFQLSPREPRNHLYFAFMARAHLTAHRYGEAVDWARKSIRWRPDITEPHLVLAAALGHLGEIDEAHEAIEECRRIDPVFMESREHWYRYKHDADAEHFLDGLRRAGWEG